MTADGGYDTQMIRDFLDHLMWEVRISHYEQTVEPGTANPELVAQLQKYSEKYGCVLLPVTRLDEDGVSDADLEALKEVIREKFRDLYGEWIRQLEALQGLFESALDCARFDIRDGTMPTRIMKAADYLKKDDDQQEPKSSG